MRCSAARLGIAALFGVAACRGSAVGETAETASSGSTGADGSSGPSSGLTAAGDVPSGLPGADCDPRTRDCPGGFKCIPVYGALTFTPQCAPIPDNPLAPGDPCPLQQPLFPTAPEDPCDENSVCASLGGDPLEGRCLTLCPDGDANCTMTGEACLSAFNGAVRVCAPTCDPLQDDCMMGGGCYPSPPNLDQFFCGPELPDAGGHGHQCQGIQALCRSSFVCSSAVLGAPNCEAQSCCSPYCDTTAPNTCPGAQLGEVCWSPYPGMIGPPGLENLGVCAIPP